MQYCQLIVVVQGGWYHYHALSHEICTWFWCVLFWFVHIIMHSKLLWYTCLYPIMTCKLIDLFLVFRQSDNQCIFPAPIKVSCSRHLVSLPVTVGVTWPKQKHVMPWLLISSVGDFYYSCMASSVRNFMISVMQWHFITCYLYGQATLELNSRFAIGLLVHSLLIVMSLTNTLQWRHNGCNSISKHQPHDCLLNRLFRRRSKKTWKLRVTGLCAGNSPGTGEFPTHMASNTENVSIWWRHHGDVTH